MTILDLFKTTRRSDIHSHDIPDLDLYIDQILTLIEDKLEDHKRYPKDKLLTKTMINNYSKAGVVQRIKGKKYSKKHIIEMLYVYQLKNTCSIQEIQDILKPIYETDTLDLSSIYDQSIDFKQQCRPAVENLIQDLSSMNLNLEDDHDRLLCLLYLSHLSHLFQLMEEKLIDTYYPHK